MRGWCGLRPAPNAVKCKILQSIQGWRIYIQQQDKLATYKENLLRMAQAGAAQHQFAFQDDLAGGAVGVLDALQEEFRGGAADLVGWLV